MDSKVLDKNKFLSFSIPDEIKTVKTWEEVKPLSFNSAPRAYFIFYCTMKTFIYGADTVNANAVL